MSDLPTKEDLDEIERLYGEYGAEGITDWVPEILTAARELHRIREKLKVPHPDRDFVNECNTLLSEKDAEIARLKSQLADADLLLGNGWEQVLELVEGNPSVETMLRCQVAKLAGDVAELEDRLASLAPQR